MGIFDNLDDLEKSGGSTGIVRSYRHINEEVLHIRLLMQDLWKQEDFDLDEKAKMRTFYVTGNGRETEVGEFMDTWSEGFIVDFTDWKGSVVPLEVLEKVRVMENMSEAEWDKRGVVISDAGWAIVEAWELSLLS